MIPATAPRPFVFDYTFPFRARVFVSQGHAPGPHKWLPHLTQATRATNRERFRGVYTFLPPPSLSYNCHTACLQPARATPRFGAVSARRITPCSAVIPCHTNTALQCHTAVQP